MREKDIQDIAEMARLPSFDETDPDAKSLTSKALAFEVAEAVDLHRVHELMHRDEYRAVAYVRFRTTDEETVRVYFRLLDQDE